MTSFILLLLLPVICLLILVGIGIFLWRVVRLPKSSNRRIAIGLGAVFAVPVFICLLWAITFNLGWFEWGWSLNDATVQMIDKTKKQAEPAVVKKAALPLFSLADTNLTSSSLPKEITSLPLFAGDPKDIGCWHNTTNSLIFMTGGGFGHWGLIICRGQPQLEDTQTLHAVVWPLSDGVFVWREL